MWEIFDGEVVSGIERTFRMDGRPADRSSDGHGCGDGERCRPAETQCDPGSQRCGYGAADLATHVHHAREDTGAASSDINRHRPEGALREVQCTSASGKDDACQLWAMHL